MLLRKMVTDCVSALLITAFLLGNLLSCSAHAKPDKKDAGITYMEDMVTSADSTISWEKDNTTYIEQAIDWENITYAEDMTVYLEDFIYYQFGEYVDDVYVVNLQNEEYIDAHLIFDDGHELDLTKVLLNLGEGTGAICLAIIPLSIPGINLPANIVRGLVVVARVVQTGIVIESVVQIINAIQETIDNVASAENDREALYRAIEGVSKIYKWGAILGTSMSIQPKAKVSAKNAKTGETVLTNFSQYGDDYARTVSQVDDIGRAALDKTDDAARALNPAEFKNKFGTANFNRVKKYAGPRYYELWNKMARGEIPINSAEWKELTALDDMLRGQSIKKPIDFLRGENAPVTVAEKIYGKSPIDPMTGRLDPARLIGSKTHNPSLTSLTTDRATANRFADGLYNTAYDPKNIKIIRHIKAPAGTTGQNISKTTGLKEGEFLRPMGQETEVLDAWKDSKGVLHTLEIILK